MWPDVKTTQFTRRMVAELRGTMFERLEDPSVLRGSPSSEGGRREPACLVNYGLGHLNSIFCEYLVIGLVCADSTRNLAEGY
jgi:hypothetical protein